MEKKDRFETKDFHVENFEREVTVEQLRYLGSTIDDETFEVLKRERKCQAVRVEHKTGVWKAEYPSYCKTFFIINAFSENDATDLQALDNLLNMYMEDTTMIGDKQYYKDIRDAKIRLAERMTEKEKNEP